MKNTAKTLNVWLITVAVFLALLLKNSKQTQQRTSDGLWGIFAVCCQRESSLCE
ncbi:MAG: hypothetical protein FWD58_07640 [Firmicutes bacterium]|nr:hypothetical protein [Bacillota bacterium]